MNELDKLRERVEAYIDRHGLTATRFGREAVGDPLFVFKLRGGREPRLATREKVNAYMKRRRSTAA